MIILKLLIGASVMLLGCLKKPHYDPFHKTLKLSKNAPITAFEAKEIRDKYLLKKGIKIHRDPNSREPQYLRHYRVYCFSKDNRYFFPYNPDIRTNAGWVNDGIYVDSNTGEVTELKESHERYNFPYGAKKSNIIIYGTPSIPQQQLNTNN